ncbi:hypothetical protein [Secundilactobacillus folii]|uniref:Uncharacterized protein n=1 Tax=Secundilactobacillus folii TaxID=2678357 RepID=A0A7X2XVT6_9LACO|nr:hypothetical protein [Secundilactobacillus folii]MTV81985.1 hypothetical protein [Secundilactobacillus folii]
MEQAIFLVTSLVGVKKLTFRQKLTTLMNDQIQITIVLAMIQFDDYQRARSIIRSQFYPGWVDQINIVTLASLMADADGVDLADSEQFNTDFESLPSRRFEVASPIENDTIRYIKDGEIVAEVTEDHNQQPLLKTRFEDHQPTQAAVYEAGRQFGLLYFQKGELSQALLLNKNRKMAFRFNRHEQTVNFAYTLGPASKLQFTELMPDEDENHHIVYQASEQRPFYEVVDYSNYDRFDSIYAFYAQLLQNLFTPVDGLFIDLNDNPKLTPYLPQQLIFNY